MASRYLIFLGFALLGLGCGREQTESQSSQSFEQKDVGELEQIEKQLEAGGITLHGDFSAQREIVERLTFEFTWPPESGETKSEQLIRPLPLVKGIEVIRKQERLQKLLTGFQIATEHVLRDPQLAEDRRKALVIKRQQAKMFETEVEKLYRQTRLNIAAQTKRNRKAIDYYRSIWVRHEKKVTSYFRSIAELDRAGIQLSWRKDGGLDVLYDSLSDYEKFIHPLNNYLRSGQNMIRFSEFYNEQATLRQWQFDGYEIPTLVTLLFFVPLLNQRDADLGDEQINLEVARYFAILEDTSRRLPGSEFATLPHDLNRIRQFLFYFANFEMLNVRVEAEEDLYGNGLAVVEIYGTFLNETDLLPSFVVWNIPFLLKAQSFNPKVVKTALKRLLESTRVLRGGRYVSYWDAANRPERRPRARVADPFRESDRLAKQALASLDDKDSPEEFAKKLIQAVSLDFQRQSTEIDKWIKKFGPIGNHSYDDAIRRGWQRLSAKRHENENVPLKRREILPSYPELSKVLISQYATIFIEAQTISSLGETSRLTDLRFRLAQLEALKELDVTKTRAFVVNDLASPSLWRPFPDPMSPAIQYVGDGKTPAFPLNF